MITDYYYQQLSGREITLYKQNKDIELKVMTEEEILNKLDTSRKHAEEGRVMDAEVAISKLRVKYRL